MGARDFVRFEPNQRVDLPDFLAIQRNIRSDHRQSWSGSLFGSDLTTAAFARKLLSTWGVTEDGGGPAATVDITPGNAFGLEELPDSSTDRGVIFGALDNPGVKVLDFTGLPPATYTVWIRFVQDPASPGARVFWNDNTAAEDVDSINTRLVVDWDVTRAILTPGAEWQAIADVVWNGVTIATADITLTRNMFFEGDEVGGFADVWGGGSDRDLNRAVFGVQDFYTWVQAVRAQMRDIVDTTGNWFDAPATDLALTAAHIALAVDAHTASPEWTGTVLLNNVDVTGLGDFQGTTNIGGAFGDWTIDTVPNFNTDFPVVAKWNFTQLQWDREADNGSEVGEAIRYGNAVVLSDSLDGKDDRFIFYGASDDLGPDLTLNINAIVSQLRSGAATITDATVYWQHHSAAAAAGPGVEIVWRFERRAFSAIDGAWTTVDSGSFGDGVGTEVGNGAAPSIEVLGLTNTVFAAADDVRLIFRLKGAAAGVAPVIYGGLISYSTDRILPS